MCINTYLLHFCLNRDRNFNRILKHDYIAVHSIKKKKSFYVLNILEHNPITKGDSNIFNHAFTH